MAREALRVLHALNAELQGRLSALEAEHEHHQNLIWYLRQCELEVEEVRRTRSEEEKGKLAKSTEPGSLRVPNSEQQLQLSASAEADPKTGISNQSPPLRPDHLPVSHQQFRSSDDMGGSRPNSEAPGGKGGLSTLEEILLKAREMREMKKSAKSAGASNSSSSGSSGGGIGGSTTGRHDSSRSHGVAAQAAIKGPGDVLRRRTAKGEKPKRAAPTLSEGRGHTLVVGGGLVRSSSSPRRRARR